MSDIFIQWLKLNVPSKLSETQKTEARESTSSSPVLAAECVQCHPGQLDETSTQNKIYKRVRDIAQW